MSNVSETPSRSPFISVWLTPRAAIDDVLRTNPRRHVLLLAGLAAVTEIAALLIQAYGFYPGFLTWRVVVAVILGGAILGIVTLFLWAWVLKWLGKWFGGTASAESIRAALAWGRVPQTLGTPISLLVFVGLVFFGLASSHALAIAFQIVVGALGVWAWVWIVLTYKHVQHFGVWRAIASLLLATLCIVLISVAPLTMRTFLFQPFNIPSGAMIPTLLPGDYIFVSKYSYGYSRFSLPFSPPLFSGRILATEPQRGDVVVFRLPKDTSIDYVKRIVGMPGDRVQMIGGVLQINGQPVKHERIEDFIGEDGTRVQQYRETLPNGVSFNTLNLTDNGFYDNTPVYAVPAGHYFVIGDNLDNSTDSRVLSQVGYIPFENLIGRAAIIFYSITEGAQPRIRSQRIGAEIH